MNAALSKMIDALDDLTPQEQWTLLGYLTNQLQSTVQLGEESQLELKVKDEKAGATTLLEQTRGIWGNSSIEVIDTELEKQRLSEWGA